MRLLVGVPLLVFSLSACVHGHDHHKHSDHKGHHHHDHGGQKQHPISNNEKIGSSLSAHRYSDIYFSGQPSTADYPQLKKQGFGVVINLREAQEEGYEEKTEQIAVKASGLSYEHVPTSKKTAVTDEFIARVTKAVMKHRGSGKVLIHCSTGNRVGMWLGGHFHKDHGFSKQESMELAQKLGLKKDSAVQRVEKYLESSD